MKIANTIRQKPYERIVFILRRHPLTFIPVFALFLLLLSIPLILYLLFSHLYPVMLAPGHVLYPIAVLFMSAYMLSIFLFFYVHFIDYYLDLWVVTNDRIVDIEQNGIFHRVITELDLYRIQDVTSQVSGLFGTLFHYGTVTVLTASYNVNIVFHNVPYPNEVRERLIQLSDEDRKYHMAQTANT